MKTLIAMITLAVSFSATAQTEVQHKNCTDFSSMGAAVMEARQVGARMSELVQVAHETWGAPEKETARKMATALVQDAYDVPRYKTEEAQNRAIRMFENDVYHLCMTW